MNSCQPPRVLGLHVSTILSSSQTQAILNHDELGRKTEKLHWKYHRLGTCQAQSSIPSIITTEYTLVTTVELSNCARTWLLNLISSGTKTRTRQWALALGQSCAVFSALYQVEIFSLPPFSSPLLQSLFLTVFTHVRAGIDQHSGIWGSRWSSREMPFFLCSFLKTSLPFLLCNVPPGHASPLPRLLRGHKLTADSLGNRKVIADPSCRLRTLVTVGFSMLKSFIKPLHCGRLIGTNVKSNLSLVYFHIQIFFRLFFFLSGSGWPQTWGDPLASVSPRLGF